MLHISWGIAEYVIGGIGDGIKCPSKGVFHLLCDYGSVLPVTMYHFPIAVETVVSPADIVFINANKYHSWWKSNNCASGEESPLLQQRLTHHLHCGSQDEKQAVVHPPRHGIDDISSENCFIE